jgi:hypothetical protein
MGKSTRLVKKANHGKRPVNRRRRASRTTRTPR